MMTQIVHNVLRLVHAQMIADRRSWPGKILSLKKRSINGEESDVLGYVAYGILTDNMLPLIVLLRDDFTRRQQYDSIDALLDDGWIID